MQKCAGEGGVSVAGWMETPRKDAPEKVTGQARYAQDAHLPGMAYGRLAVSPVAHGRIVGLDVSAAQAAPGVLSVLTGSGALPLAGVLVRDRPILAFDFVRYVGEPLALVVARSEAQAAHAAGLVRADIEPLEPVDSVERALQPDAPLVHTKVGCYAKLVDDVYPRVNSNVASEYAVRKGDPANAWSACAAIVEQHFSLPASAHAAMETRCAQAELRADGTLWIRSSTQSPFAVRQLISEAFALEAGQVRVEAPFLGGGFGGKSAVQLEYLAALAARALPGTRVEVDVTRAQDMTTLPCRAGLTADVKLGANAEGELQAAELRFLLDCGAYADIGPNMAKAIAVDCTGPYHVDHLYCDALCVYTNHTYCTAFRGFAHESYTFCVERAMDELARRLGMDPLTLRAKNAIRPGQFTPTQVQVSDSNTGNLTACIERLKPLIGWDEGERIEIGRDLVRARGVACLWKTPNPPTNASAGAVITFNGDGSINLNVGVVEMGNAGTTHLAQMAAEKLRMPCDRVHVTHNVDTRLSPEYWKTVASMSSYLAGRAVCQAADDALAQLKAVASIALRSPVEDLEHGNERIFLRHEPRFAIGYADLALGLTLPDGNAVGRQVIGRGSAVLSHVGPLAQDTGRGKTGQAWTVGAQGVEIELNLRTGDYRLLNAATVMDVGTVLDEAETCAMIRGGMSMGLSLAKGETLDYDEACAPRGTGFRTYKLLHVGEEPRYAVELVSTPQIDAPFGVRSYSEHGIIGIPAALGNALSTAAQRPLNQTPLTPESVWRAMKGGQ